MADFDPIIRQNQPSEPISRPSSPEESKAKRVSTDSLRPPPPTSPSPLPSIKPAPEGTKPLKSALQFFKDLKNLAERQTTEIKDNLSNLGNRLLEGGKVAVKHVSERREKNPLTKESKAEIAKWEKWVQNPKDGKRTQEQFQKDMGELNTIVKNLENKPKKTAEDILLHHRLAEFFEDAKMSNVFWERIK